MKHLSFLAAFFALSATVHCAPASKNSAAIAVDGNYVYVVENGAVYKLSARDLKPVARTVLPSAISDKKSRAATKKPRRNTRQNSRPKARRNSRSVAGRNTRRAFPKTSTALRKAPVTVAPIKEAPLPPSM